MTNLTKSIITFAVLFTIIFWVSGPLFKGSVTRDELLVNDGIIIICQGKREPEYKTFDPFVPSLHVINSTTLFIEQGEPGHRVDVMLSSTCNCKAFSNVQDFLSHYKDDLELPEECQ